MAERKKDNSRYKELKRAINEGSIGNAYVFTGEERYLLEYSLSEMRKKLIPEGTEEFNHRRLDGKGLSVFELSEAVDTLPAFSERTMIEVYDFDFSRMGEDSRAAMLTMLSELPEYVCLVFVYDTQEFKLDARVKVNSQIKKLLTAVEFTAQEKSDLVNWAGRRYKALGKRIDRDTAEYLAFVSGGLMTQMITEIEKTAAYCKGDIITREDIDAVVEPVLDAAVYKMTDALVARRFDDAAAILSDLLGMNEAPHKIMFSVSMKLRQLFAARVCFEDGYGVPELMDIGGIKYEFQARSLMDAAKRLSSGWCRRAVRLAAETAFSLNSGSGEECLTDLLLRLSERGESDEAAYKRGHSC